MSIGRPLGERPIRREKNRSIVLRLAELKHLGVLEKERPLLGEEQREPRQVHLLLVRFDLREVGVDRHIERQVGPHAPLHVEPDVTRAIDRLGEQRLVVVDRADDVRHELDLAPRGQVQAAQLAGHRDAVERCSRAAPATGRPVRSCAGCCASR